VASRLLSIHSQHRLANELAVIAGEYLIGRIQQLGPFTARLLLFSDPQSPPHPVRIGRLADGRFSPLSKQDPRTGRWQPCTFLLRGLGDGVMAIEQVLADYIADRPGSQTAAVRNPIRLGDLVVSLPDEPRLPCTMVIAELTGLQPDPRNPLIYNLEARCPVDPTRLRWVYVVDMSAPSGD
ncbi:MAG: rod shape-determining protein MreC, partial [Phycisphaerae bacterium]